MDHLANLVDKRDAIKEACLRRDATHTSLSETHWPTPHCSPMTPRKHSNYGLHEYQGTDQDVACRARARARKQRSDKQATRECQRYAPWTFLLRRRRSHEGPWPSGNRCRDLRGRRSGLRVPIHDKQQRDVPERISGELQAE